MAIDTDHPPGQAALRRGRRRAEGGRAYLITTCTARRQRLFERWHIGRLVVDEMRRLDELGSVRSLAWVVMPDHWHWLLQLPPDGRAADLSELMRSVKGRSAVAINRALKRSGSVWQHGYHDHAIRSEEDLRTIARYVIANPVRARFAADIGGYPLWDSTWQLDDIVAME